ncbi:MAG TPA: radical SAM protein [Polyangiaceae bacterium]|jgi:MoaA/NifB/PqqE/SkfB family radical SAM enzyme
MHRLPLLTDTAHEPSPARAALGTDAPRPAKAGENARFRARDYVRYGARLAKGMLGSRLFGAHRPLMVNIEPTHRCNLDCTYCDKVDPRSPQMDTEKALRMLDELAELGTLSVCFDGGEPLVHPGIERFVERAKAHGMRVSMSTNGHLLKRKPNVLRFVDKVKISVDGPAHVHDAGRGRGSFEQAMHGARLALDAGTGVAIRMTLGAHNVAHYREVLRFAKEMRIQALFQPAIGNIMNGADAPEAHSADSAAYRDAIDELMQLKAEGEPVGNEMLCLEHLRNWPEPKPVPFCSGGRVEVAIGPDGGMFPCGRTGRNLKAPNVFEVGVAEAFEHVLRPTDCANCWCTLTLAGCYLYRGDVRLLALG